MQALRGFLTRENVLLNSLREIMGAEGKEAEQKQLEARSRGGYVRPWEDSPEGVRWIEALQVNIVENGDLVPPCCLSLSLPLSSTLSYHGPQRVSQSIH